MEISGFLVAVAIFWLASKVGTHNKIAYLRFELERAKSNLNDEQMNEIVDRAKKALNGL